MSLAQWQFDDATEHHTADGRHVFYRVAGHRTSTAVVSGMRVRVGYGGLGLIVDVTGEGATREAALEGAMRRAIAADDEARDVAYQNGLAMLRAGVRWGGY